MFDIRVGIGTTTPNTSSALDITSTTKGFLMPRMTTTERTAIATPATGLQVYDTTTNSQWFYNGTVWVQGASKADASKWTNDETNAKVSLTNLSDGTSARPTGTEFVISDTGNIGIGTATPAKKLSIESASANILSIKRIGANGGAYIDLTNGNDQVGGIGLGSSPAQNIASGPKLLFSTNGPNRMSIDANGSVQVGNTGASGYSILDVNGYVKLRSTDAIGDAAIVIDPNRGVGFIRYNNGLQYHNGTAWNTVATTATGSYWTNDATNTKVSLTNLSDGTTARPTGTEFVISDTGNIGIGTATPAKKLSIESASANILSIKRIGANGGAYIDLTNGNDQVGGIGLGSSPAQNIASGPKLLFSTNGPNRMSIDANGSVQVGNTGASGYSILDVNGYVKLRSTDAIGDAAIVIDPNRGVGFIRYNNGLQYYNGTAWNTVATTTVGSKWTNNTTSSRVELTTLSNGTTTRTTGTEFIVKDSGNVGIGVTTPTEKLEVNGAIKIGTTTTASPTAGTIRFNSTTSTFEGYNGTTWVAFH